MVFRDTYEHVLLFCFLHINHVHFFTNIYSMCIRAVLVFSFFFQWACIFSDFQAWWLCNICAIANGCYLQTDDVYGCPLAWRMCYYYLHVDTCTCIHTRIVCYTADSLPKQSLHQGHIHNSKLNASIHLTVFIFFFPQETEISRKRKECEVLEEEVKKKSQSCQTLVRAFTRSHRMLGVVSDPYGRFYCQSYTIRSFLRFDSFGSAANGVEQFQAGLQVLTNGRLLGLINCDHMKTFMYLTEIIWPFC